MSDATPTRNEILTALVIYRALGGGDTPPPSISELASPELIAQYAAEAERGLAALERAAVKARGEAPVSLPGNVVGTMFEDGTSRVQCEAEDCECPVHGEDPPAAGTYLTIRLDDADAAIHLGRANLVFEGAL